MKKEKKLEVQEVDFPWAGEEKNLLWKVGWRERKKKKKYITISMMYYSISKKCLQSFSLFLNFCKFFFFWERSKKMKIQKEIKQEKILSIVKEKK